MKHILVVIAGASDHAADEQTEKTPLDLAKVPNLNHFAKIGKVGQVKLFSDRLHASSDVTLMNLLGYDAQKSYTGRGPIEAANLDLKLEDNEIAFRMNFITEANGKLADPTGGRLSTKEARALINFLNKKVASDFVRFFPGSEYRHIAVLKDSHGYDALSAKTDSPETMVGEPLDQHFPKGPGEELLKKLMYDARLLLQDHEINQVRVDLQENPSNMIWLWGQGKRPVLESFESRFGISSAMVAGTEFALGLARLAGMTAVDTASGLHEREEDLDAIAGLALETAAEKDLTVLYLNACDEASRLGDSKAKISALEGIDYFVLSRIRKFLEDTKDTRVMITTCHTAPWRERQHLKQYVPFAAAGKNIMADDIERFSEAGAKAAELKMASGADLLKFFLSK